MRDSGNYNAEEMLHEMQQREQHWTWMVNQRLQIIWQSSTVNYEYDISNNSPCLTIWLP
jgi:hypothetical protein